MSRLGLELPAGEALLPNPPIRPGPPESPSQATTIYDGPGLVGGRLRRVRSAESASAIWLWVGQTDDNLDLGPVAVARGGATIWLPPDWPATPHALGDEFLLGPVLTLALALDGVFCLHASAVALGGRTVAFVGDSGSGKSTLAAYFEHGVAGPWRHVADDILPIEGVGGGVLARPHFPQLKMEAAGHYSASAPDRLKLAEVYVLNKYDPYLYPNCLRLDPRRGMLALLKATVASRLFPRTALARQMALLRFVVESNTVIYSLDYPHDPRSLAPVAALVALTMN